jgi:hypothetical protein
MLDGLIDYAGLFPPASLDLAAVARNYAVYRRGRTAWMLGRLVLPAGRLPEFSEAADAVLPHGEGVVPWRLSALLTADLQGDVARVEAFNQRHAENGRAVVDTVEVRVGSPEDVARTGAVRPPGLRLACEVPAPTVGDEVLAAIASAGAIAKVRTGGVVADAFPSTRDLATFLWRVARRRVPIKATAGLHHPVRGEQRLTYDANAPVATMHGFLNVVMGAAWAYEQASDGAPAEAPEELVAVLEARDTSRLRVGEACIAWDAVAVSVDALDTARRRFGLSIGSCSFEEPVAELKALGLLGA